jgi:hypothetical protein
MACWVTAASGHGVLGHGSVRPDQDCPAMSKKNEGASTKNGRQEPWGRKAGAM